MSSHDMFRNRYRNVRKTKIETNYENLEETLIDESENNSKSKYLLKRSSETQSRRKDIQLTNDVALIMFQCKDFNFETMLLFER